MIHIENDGIKIEGDSIVELSADVTIALEVIGCVAILETGRQDMKDLVIDSICDKAKKDLEQPHPLVWENAKDVMIEIIRRGRHDQG